MARSTMPVAYKMVNGKRVDPIRLPDIEDLFAELARRVVQEGIQVTRASNELRDRVVLRAMKEYGPHMTKAATQMNMKHGNFAAMVYRVGRRKGMVEGVGLELRRGQV